MSKDVPNKFNNYAPATSAKNETMEKLLEMNRNMSQSIAALTKENEKFFALLKTLLEPKAKNKINPTSILMDTVQCMGIVSSMDTPAKYVLPTHHDTRKQQPEQIHWVIAKQIIQKLINDGASQQR